MIQSFYTTGIGSFPHTDPAEACKIIISSVDIPFWPQLPHRSFLELMVPQYLEGFPFVKIRGEHISVEKAGQEEIASFYEAIEANKGFPISRQNAQGLYAFLDLLKKREQKLNLVKGHVTGPLTFTLSITDAEKRAIYFDEEMRELSLELLKGKVTWQINILKPYADKIILFIDEPILSALGTSAYLSVDAEETLRLLSELTRHIRDAGALSGIHCCSKADWPLVLSAQPDIFSFDAYFFWDTLSLYPEALAEFVTGNGYIAWGIVPTTDAIRNVTLDGLREQLDRAITSLEKTGIPPDTLRQQALLTPSCGTGSLNPDDALRVFSLLKDLRESYVTT